MKLNSFIFISLSLVLYSCATPMTLPFQLADEEQKNQILLDTDLELAQIFLKWHDPLRDKNVASEWGGYYTCSIDDKEQANMLANSFISLKATPGEHKVECVKRKPNWQTKVFDKEDQRGGVLYFSVPKGKAAVITLHHTTPILEVDVLELEAAKNEVTNNQYLLAANRMIEGTYEDPTWAHAYKNKDLTSIRTFIRENPYSGKIEEAKKLESAWLAEQKRDFQKAENSKSAKDFIKYLNKWPRPFNEQAVLDRLLPLIANSKDKTSLYGELYSKHPHTLALFPKEAQDNVLIFGIGPKGMTVGELISMRKAGRSNALLAAKVSSSTHPYKNFSFEETDFLKAQGLGEEVIGAMIAVTAKLGKTHQTPSNLKGSLSNTRALEEAGEDNSIAGAAQEAATDCAKYIAAKKACSLIPFGSGICISALSSKFDSTTIAVCDKLPL